MKKRKHSRNRFPVIELQHPAMRHFNLDTNDQFVDWYISRYPETPHCCESRHLFHGIERPIRDYCSGESPVSRCGFFGTQDALTDFRFFPGCTVFKTGGFFLVAGLIPQHQFDRHLIRAVGLGFYGLLARFLITPRTRLAPSDSSGGAFSLNHCRRNLAPWGTLLCAS